MRVSGSTNAGFCSCSGKREVEDGSCSKIRVDPDATAVSLNDLLTDGQTDAGSGIGVGAVQTLEDSEYLLRVLRIDPDTVVLDIKLPPCAFAPRGYFDPGRRCPSIFNCISNQVLKKLFQMNGLNSNYRQFIKANDSASLFDGRL